MYKKLFVLAFLCLLLLYLGLLAQKNDISNEYLLSENESPFAFSQIPKDIHSKKSFSLGTLEELQVPQFLEKDSMFFYFHAEYGYGKNSFFERNASSIIWNDNVFGIFPDEFEVKHRMVYQQIDEVERFMEDGIEVIVNHLEPYKVKGKPSILHLELEFKIDTEKKTQVDLGLTDILCFDVDSTGNIYILVRQARKDAIYKFDQQGNFVQTFGRMGEGPGEIANTEHLTVGPMDSISVADPFRKLITYDKNGIFKNEVDLDPQDMEAWPLENGNYLVNKRNLDPKSQYEEWPLILCDSELGEIKELDRYRRLNWRTSGKFEIPPYDLIHSISNGRIYIGNSEKGYEIRVYSLDGNLERKIRKEYNPVKVTEEFEKETLKEFDDPRVAVLRDKVFFQKNHPAFQYLFTDDEGHIFVMTNEEGDRPKEYIYDIFNDDGLFISRVSLEHITGMSQWNLQVATARNERLYCIKEKENGFKELLVYIMSWE